MRPPTTLAIVIGPTKTRMDKVLVVAQTNQWVAETREVDEATLVVATGKVADSEEAKTSRTMSTMMIQTRMQRTPKRRMMIERLSIIVISSAEHKIHLSYMITLAESIEYS